MNYSGCLRLTLLLGSLCCVALLPHADASHTPLELTPQEHAWIEAHPVLRVAALDNLTPIEYIEGGQLKGLSAEYLQFIADKTGLRLAFIPAHSIEDRIALLMSGKADLISTLRLNGPSGNDPRLLYTTHYLNTTAVVVTRTQHPPILYSDQLNGLTVTLPYFDRYRDVVTARAPNAKIIIGGGAMTMLQQVADGTADAAVATEAYLMPYLYKRFQGQLQISGVLTDMVSKIGMSTRADQPLLHSIIQKVIDSMTLDEVRAIHASWIDDHATRNLALSEITDHYPHEVALVGIVVLLLLGLSYQTHRMRQRAERNEREKAMFLAVMSHEIRSPMNAVLAAVELLHNTPLDKQQQHFVGLAGTGAQSLLTLLDDVLDLSKLDAGQLKLEREPVNLPALVQNVADLHSLRARERHLSISVVGDSQAPLLMLDDTRLAQVLHNLLSNAIKFTETGGIEVSYLITETSTPGLKHIRMTVTDTGIGISPEAQQRLFQPYSQAARSYRRSGGTGLGLAICRDLLKLMDGGITLDSEVGKGTRIEVSLVAEVASAVEIEAVESESPTPHPGTTLTHNLRILVVEDTPANQAVLQAQIEGFGCTAVIARDGAQAMDCFEQSNYDLILMDCDLPDQDGYSLTSMFRMIERDAGQPPCPIIAISASTDNEHISRCFDAGMDGILGKPISLGKLQDTIEVWCGVPLTLVPRPFAEQDLMADTRIIEALEQDLLALLEAITLQQREPALHAAHRLHGAALSIEWPSVAREAGALEKLLKTGTTWQDPTYAQTLQGLIRALRSPERKSAAQIEPAPQSSV
ncbi:ATP-binding protein [Pseudomonas koreensis]|uniref:ATP-binding protein n=1 Tax=Pseudomonas koreensis TaxID=198620 RepID=UPI0021C87FB0|nr:ATP-binding protein [Pseudomonas koreensis]MCU0070028.1 ATP-binding protein [Pseudomonas koreensis]